jgi:hypothetical protein
VKETALAVAGRVRSDIVIAFVLEWWSSGVFER